jgi:hypothetical protein
MSAVVTVLLVWTLGVPLTVVGVAISAALLRARRRPATRATNVVPMFPVRDRVPGSVPALRVRSHR